MPNRNLSKHQFNLHPKDHQKRSIADRVFAQLTEDYPIKSLSWIHSVDWSGPKKVPVEDIEWQDEQTWKAEKEQAKVKMFERKVRAARRRGEEIKPIIVMDFPSGFDMVPDGHHRALAEKNIGDYVWGYVGKTSHRKGPWDHLHDYQFKEDKTGSSTGA